ncbi:hypothetical protein B7463_g7809, partial [Scytalidium lignicola]
MSSPSRNSPDYAKLYDSNRSNDGNESDVDATERESRSLRVHSHHHVRYGSVSPSARPPTQEPYDRERRESFIQEDEDPLQVDLLAPKVEEKPITWSSLPRKRQLAILTVARLSEPLVQTSLRSYLFYQLKSFDKTLPDSVIASQAGIMQGSFAAAQLCTAMLWGRFSDSRGRKTTLLIGLFGTTISCVGFGFSKTFAQAMFFRMMGGALNGNVGVMRTMISEIVREKKYQSRAFLLLPMCANIGTIIGPILGGLMADPAANYPSLFGGIKFLEDYPYAPPNLLSACFLCSAALAVFFGLEETLESLSNTEDIGTKLGRFFSGVYRRIFSKKGQPNSDDYVAIPAADPAQGVLVRRSSIDVELSAPPSKPKKRVAPRYKSRLPFRKIFTYNVVSTLVSHGLLAGTMGTFNNVWYSFLSTPVYNPSSPANADYHPHLPFVFTGGIGLPPRDVGVAMAILGTIGITLQLFLYPWVNARLGTVRAWRVFLYCFPIVYVLAPYLALVHSTTPPPYQKTGFLLWISLSGILFSWVIARTFATPASAILINNCSPHPSVLGTIHGIGQSASSAARTIGPAFGGWLYGYGLEKGVVGIVFWSIAVMAVGNVVASTFVTEGNGHEIRLDGDDEAEAEAERENRKMGFT